MRMASPALQTLLLLLLLSTPSAAKRPVSVIYPLGQTRLRFSHQNETHQQITCRDCHGDVGTSVSAKDRHLPREAACRGCHGELTRADDSPAKRLAGGKRCDFCHTGYSGSGIPPKIDQPQAHLRFSHRLHKLKWVGCIDCHDFKPGRGSLPRMSDCLNCHRRRNGPKRCTVCHLSRKDGKLVTRFGSERLRPSGVLNGIAHTPAFSRQHSAAARTQKRLCDSCHREQDCLRCHAGTMKPLRIHGNDYLTHHALDARRNQPRCRSCHRSQTFCLSCHQRLGVATSSRLGGFRPSTSLRFHPPGWATTQVGSGHHSSSARRNIASCVSCHKENSCVRCHGSRTIGKGGFSPHPSGFGRSLKCRALASRNQRVCVKCHQVGDPKLRCE